MKRPLTPSLSPSDGERVADLSRRRLGEGGRSGEGMVHGPNACKRRNGALHEPTPHPFPLPIRWGEGGRRSGEGWFMVPMHAQKRKGAFHEPSPYPACGHPLPALRGEGRERGANLVHGPNACEKRKGVFHERVRN